ncbi:hypothetical protein ACXYL9_10330 [Qipengyuania sp. CAU 1752]
MINPESIEKLSEALEQFNELDDGHQYWGEQIFYDPEAEKGINAARRVLEVAIEALVNTLPKRVFDVAYGDLPTSAVEGLSESDAARRALLSFFDRLWILRPLLFAGGNREDVASVIFELGEHIKGGEGVLFGKSPFEGFGNRKPAAIASLRLDALVAYSVGRENGRPAHELQGQISDAFGASFDTIRKWDNYCQRVFEPKAFAAAKLKMKGVWEARLETGKFDEYVLRQGKHYQEFWRDARK